MNEFHILLVLVCVLMYILGLLSANDNNFSLRGTFMIVIIICFTSIIVLKEKDSETIIYLLTKDLAEYKTKSELLDNFIKSNIKNYMIQIEKDAIETKYKDNK